MKVQFSGTGPKNISEILIQSVTWVLASSVSARKVISATTLLAECPQKLTDTWFVSTSKPCMELMSWCQLPDEIPPTRGPVIDSTRQYFQQAHRNIAMLEG
jgi:hypothetical protein